MSEKMKWLDNYVPPGISGYRELVIYMVLVVIVGIQSFLVFIIRYANALSDLYVYRLGKRVLAGYMPPFEGLIENVFLVTGIVAIVILSVTIYHYMYHYQGSKMMYLMKRLPDKTEVYRRCWTLPVTGVVLMVVWMFVLRMLYFTIYMLCTPSQCLPL